ADVIIMPRLTKAQTPTNSTYTAFLRAVEASQAKVVSAKPGSVYNLGGATFEILGPVTDDAEDINNMSAVTKLTFGENTFLITGDAETEEELEILDNGADIDCDVLRAGHHGSYTSSCKDWLAAATPEICVISCGEGNDYGHPHDTALKRIKKHTQEIYRTDICGDIVMVSDGKNITVDYAA
ncbi:MAG: MBL fold metallo-hydrolase, partial [Clostridia bacterium]|nr:MBL fold metallo-hydrolase [Clostridia bacterium]